MNQIKRRKISPFPPIICNGDCKVLECLYNFNELCLSQIPPNVDLVSMNAFLVKT